MCLFCTWWTSLWLLDPTDFIIGVDAASAIVTALENDNDVTVLVGGGTALVMHLDLYGWNVF